MRTLDRKKIQIYITPWRAASSPLKKELMSSVSQPIPWEQIVMYNYPVLECLVAFASVFLIGFLFAYCARRGEPVVPKGGLAHT